MQPRGGFHRRGAPADLRPEEGAPARGAQDLLVFGAAGNLHPQLYDD
jgi:hypothetical protein